jgi:hypothetical protein
MMMMVRLMSCQACHACHTCPAIMKKREGGRERGGEGTYRSEGCLFDVDTTTVPVR